MQICIILKVKSKIVLPVIQHHQLRNRNLTDLWTYVTAVMPVLNYFSCHHFQKGHLLTMKLKGDPLKFTVNITLDYILDDL